MALLTEADFHRCVGETDRVIQIPNNLVIQTHGPLGDFPFGLTFRCAESEGH